MLSRGAGVALRSGAGAALRAPVAALAAVPAAPVASPSSSSVAAAAGAAAALRRRYDEDGVVVLRQAVPEFWLAHLREASRMALAHPGPEAEQYAEAPGFYFSDLELAERLEPFRRFAREGPCAAVAGELMGASEVCFLYDQYFHQRYGDEEAARAPATTPWHQDQPYWNVEGSQVCSVWVPLDPVPLESAVSYIAGSHKWGLFAPRHFATGQCYSGTGLDSVPSLSGRRRLAWATEPGDVIVFAGPTFHGQEDAKRVFGEFRRLSLRFTGDDARYCRRTGEAADVIPSRHHPCTLQPGDRMRCERFPLVWRRPASE